jgi:hypothetical protein
MIVLCVAGAEELPQLMIVLCVAVAGKSPHLMIVLCGRHRGVTSSHDCFVW